MSLNGQSFSDGLPLTRVQQERFKAALLAARSGALLVSAQRQAVRDILQSAGNLTQRPEQCVIAFKSFLNEAANELGIPLGRERSSLFERFVTVFIEEMYVASGAITDEASRRGKTVGSAIPVENREQSAVRL